MVGFVGKLIQDIYTIIIQEVGYVNEDVLNGPPPIFGVEKKTTPYCTERQTIEYMGKST